MRIEELQEDQKLDKVFWKRVLTCLLMIYWKQDKTKLNHKIKQVVLLNLILQK